MQPQDNQPPVNPTPAPSSTPPVHNPLATMRPGEKVLCEIKRHPIGLLGLYLSVGLVLLLIVLFGFGLATEIFPDTEKAKLYSYSSVALLVAGLFSVIAVLVGHTVYWGNRWIITDDSITQILQLSLFNKQSSQLSMANLEDIASEKSGILPNLFNYGTLKAETAGERQKFRMTFCPNPDHYAKIILAAREAFEQDNYRIAAMQQREAMSANQPPFQAPQTPPQTPPQAPQQ